MHIYDLNLILDPGLNEHQIQVEKDAVVAQIERAAGEILAEDDWGNKRLAYEIRKLREGHYIIYTVKLAGDTPKAIELNLRQRDNVMRVLIVRQRPDWNTRKVREVKPKEAATA